MRTRGNSLVGVLAAMCIIAILGVVTFMGTNAFGKPTSSRADGKGTTVPGLVRAKAVDEVCKSNLSQQRQSLSIARMSGGDEEWPASLSESRLGPAFETCPLGKEAYTYDASTGEVHCPHPGHEKY